MIIPKKKGELGGRRKDGQKEGLRGKWRKKENNRVSGL